MIIIIFKSLRKALQSIYLYVSISRVDNNILLDLRQMDADQKEKQHYLFKEIIEKNYDPEQFQEYITRAKEGGDDLQNWPINDLKDIVKKFQKQYEKGAEERKEIEEQEQLKQNTHKNSMIEEFLESEELDKSMNKSQKLETFEEIDYDSNNEVFSKQIECIQLPPTALSGAKNPQANVTKFQKKEGGMFEQSYVSYFIHTPILGKTVERRYSDFEWLKDILEWLHPGMPIPPIAKKGQFRRYDDKHLKKRMMILEMFLKKILQAPELRAEVVVQNFLKLDDKVAFQKFKAGYVKNQKIPPFKTVKNSKGHLTLKFDPQANNFLFKAQRHFTQIQPSIKELYKEYKSAATSLETCGQTLRGISQKCQALDEVERSFRKNNKISYCPNNFFTMLSQAMTRLAGQITNQARIFRTEIYSILKYESLYMLNILDGFDSLASVQQKYQDAKLALTKKKVKLFEQGNVEKWEADRKFDKNNRTESMKAMLPKETAKLAKIRDVYGLYNAEMHQEISRYFATKNAQLANRLQTCCRTETRLCTEMMMIWVDAQTNIIGINENKSIVRC